MCLRLAKSQTNNVFKSLFNLFTHRICYLSKASVSPAFPFLPPPLHFLTGLGNEYSRN